MFKILIGTTKQLHKLFEDMNKIHPSLKFTMNHTTPAEEPETDRCECQQKESIPFLDTSLSIENGRIEIDLYKKETDRNQYLLRESCHPAGITSSIPFSLSLRIVRICTKTENRDKRRLELKKVLQERGYPEQTIDRGIYRARKIPRKIALLKIRKNTTQNRPVFAIKYDPRLPPLQKIQAKHWRAMIGQDKYLSDVFKQPPLTAYRRHRNLRDLLIKSKVPPPAPLHPKREIKGMAPCNKGCTSCPYVERGREVKIDGENTWSINRKVNCETYNCI